MAAARGRISRVRWPEGERHWAIFCEPLGGRDWRCLVGTGNDDRPTDAEGRPETIYALRLQSDGPTFFYEDGFARVSEDLVIESHVLRVPDEDMDAIIMPYALSDLYADFPNYSGDEQ